MNFVKMLSCFSLITKDLIVGRNSVNKNEEFQILKLPFFVATLLIRMQTVI